MPPAKKPNPLPKATNVDTRIGNATVATIISHRKLTKAVFLPTINKIPYECWSDGKEGALCYVINGNRLARCAWFSRVVVGSIYHHDYFIAGREEHSSKQMGWNKRVTRREPLTECPIRDARLLPSHLNHSSWFFNRERCYHFVYASWV